jgi:hypothetical protein
MTAIPLPVGRYWFRFVARDQIRLPDYPGSAWRGAFGHALKRTVCVTRQPVCKDCLLYRSCYFPYIFDTPPAEASVKMRKYDKAPHPYALDIQPSASILQPGQDYLLGVTLIGRGNDFLPYFIHALAQAGEGGIGAGHGRLALQSVEQCGIDPETRQVIYRPGEPLTALPVTTPVPSPIPRLLKLSFSTPLRFKTAGQLTRAAGFTFGSLFSNLLRRISMLSYFHASNDLELDFKGLVTEAKSVPILDHTLRWRDWIRYSKRQQETMKMGGLIGDIYLSGEDIEPYWPFLWLGHYVHAGTATTMGLGRYDISEMASLPSRTSAGKSSSIVTPINNPVLATQ